MFTIYMYTHTLSYQVPDSNDEEAGLNNWWLSSRNSLYFYLVFIISEFPLTYSIHRVAEENKNIKIHEDTFYFLVV